MKKSVMTITTASVLAVCVTGCMLCQKGQTMNGQESSVVVKPFGKTKDGQLVHQYTLTGAGGVVMDVIDYGGKIVRLYTPDRMGKTIDITAGFNTVAGYETCDPYFGSLIGRFGNRIANGKFTLDGKTYTLPTNNEPGGIPCSLHGGTKGFDSVVWQAEPLTEGKTVGLRLSMTSPDGDQGYPGTLKIQVTYWLTPENIWRIEYNATTDKATPVNLTQHLYFNFKGEASGDILDHELTLFSDKTTPVDKGLIPTGKTASVKGTPFDFTTPHVIGERINAKNEQLEFGGGYDHNWVLDNPNGKLVKAAALFEKTTGRYMEVWTTEPAIQFYCGNFMTDKMPSKTPGKNLCYRGGLALETQHSPDSPNQPNFPSTILRPGAVYKTTTEYRFGIK
ncbi:MAG: aldose epimerase family protein [bacterium]